MSNNKEDILIFTNGNIFSLIILSNFIKHYRSRIYKIIIVSGDYKGRSGLSAKFTYILTTSVFYVFYKYVSLILIKIFRHIFRFKIANVRDLAQLLNIESVTVSNINDELLFQHVSKSQVDYIISVSCPQLINGKWLSLVGNKAINIHGSMLPAFSGLAPYFWVLSKGEKTSGISVHYLTRSFDKGDLLSQESVTIERNESCMSLFLKKSIVGSNLLIDSFEKMTQGSLGVSQNFDRYSYFSHPTTIAYFNLKKNGFYLLRLIDILSMKKEVYRINSLYINCDMNVIPFYFRKNKHWTK